MTPAKDLIEREVYEAIQLDHARLLRNITALLKAIGADPGQCKGCPAPVLWVRHANGKLTPYDRDGTNHFITCPNARQFKK
jgi:hypothetical protein